jgi:Ca2+-binding EF-hand superfamily protein
MTILIRILVKMDAAKINETFIIYAGDNGEVPTSELGTCIRALGWNPTETEVQVLIVC